MKFTMKEIKDLTISIVVLSLVFSSFEINAFIPMLFIMVAVFASHEILGHKLVAQHYGCEATYRMWFFGLLLGVVTSFLGGFIFAAPGAVYISPVVKKQFAFNVARITKKEYAIISLAGPLVNIIVAFALIAVNAFYPWSIFLLTAKLSFFLAIFNMIPFPPLDGQKIIGWDWRVWLILIGSAILGYMFLISV